MNDESCGCPCYDCSHHDVHQCENASCGYTKYARAKKPPKPPVPVASTIEIVKEHIGTEFKLIRDPASKARLLEWGKCVAETAKLDEGERRKIRAARQLEIFGVPL